MSGRRKVTLHGGNTIIEANKPPKGTVFSRLGSERSGDSSRKVRHASPTRRKPSVVSVPDLEPCRMWEKTGDCPYGSNCKNAHPEKKGTYSSSSSSDAHGSKDRMINIDAPSSSSVDTPWHKKPTTRTISNDEATHHRSLSSRGHSPAASHKRKRYAPGGDEALERSESSSRRNPAEAKGGGGSSSRPSHDEYPAAKRRRHTSYDDRGDAGADVGRGASADTASKRLSTDSAKPSKREHQEHSDHQYKAERFERTISTKSHHSEESAGSSSSSRVRSSSSHHTGSSSTSTSSAHHSHASGRRVSRTSDAADPHDANFATGHSSRTSSSHSSRHTHAAPGSATTSSDGPGGGGGGGVGVHSRHHASSSSSRHDSHVDLSSHHAAASDKSASSHRSSSSRGTHHHEHGDRDRGRNVSEISDRDRQQLSSKHARSPEGHHRSRSGGDRSDRRLHDHGHTAAGSSSSSRHHGKTHADLAHDRHQLVHGSGAMHHDTPSPRIRTAGSQQPHQQQQQAHGKERSRVDKRPDRHSRESSSSRSSATRPPRSDSAGARSHHQQHSRSGSSSGGGSRAGKDKHHHEPLDTDLESRSIAGRGERLLPPASSSNRSRTGDRHEPINLDADGADRDLPSQAESVAATSATAGVSVSGAESDVDRERRLGFGPGQLAGSAEAGDSNYGDGQEEEGGSRQRSEMEDIGYDLSESESDDGEGFAQPLEGFETEDAEGIEGDLEVMDEVDDGTDGDNDDHDASDSDDNDSDGGSDDDLPGNEAPMGVAPSSSSESFGRKRMLKAVLVKKLTQTEVRQLVSSRAGTSGDRMAADRELGDDFSEGSWSPMQQAESEMTRDDDHEGEESMGEGSDNDDDGEHPVYSLYQSWCSEDEDEEFLALLHAAGPVDEQPKSAAPGVQSLLILPSAAAVTGLDSGAMPGGAAAAAATVGKDAGVRAAAALYEDMDAMSDDDDLNEILRAESCAGDDTAKADEDASTENDIPTTGASVEDIDWSVLAQEQQKQAAALATMAAAAAETEAPDVSPEQCLEKFTAKSIFESCGLSLQLVGEELLSSVRTLLPDASQLDVQQMSQTPSCGALVQSHFQRAADRSFDSILKCMKGHALTARKDLAIRQQLKNADDDCKVILSQTASAIPGDGAYLRPSLELYHRRSVLTTAGNQPRILASAVGSVLAT
eukprot:scpid45911/ scgid3565/ 